MARSRFLFYNKFSLHIYLRRPTPDGWYRVRIVCYFHGTDFSVSPGIRILAKQQKGRKVQELFEPKTGRVLADHPEAEDINEQLGIWEKKLRDAFRSLAGPTGTVQVTREMMEQAIFPAATEPEQTPAPAPVPPAELPITTHYAEWKQENTGLYSESHLNHYKAIVEQLEAWKPGLKAGELTEKVLLEWRKMLVAQGITDGTIAEHYKFFRMLATRIGANPKAPYLRYKAVYAVQPDLHREEMQALLTVRLEDPRLAEERDRWLLQCLTGRRDGDLRTLTTMQLTTLRTEEGEVVAALRHYQDKTGAEVLLPLPPLAVRIGERWQWQLPERARGTRNQRLKEIAQLAGLERLFNDAKIVNGKAQNDYRPMWHLISTHTARHTAGSLLLEFSKGDKSLSSFLLGHAQSSTTDIYAKDKARRVAGPLMEAWKAILGPYYDARPSGWIDAADGGPERAKEYQTKRKKAGNAT
ncbi:hypothetical protein [Hymenobacter sp. UYP22]|uniref:hypothetical protein n=1 Tax=Hymenobacter sp. UYP22 TaxID=3156348 RepID=UPI00339A0F24